MTHNVLRLPTYVQITLQLYNAVHQLLYTTNNKKRQYFTTSHRRHLEWLQHGFSKHHTGQGAGRTSTDRAALLCWEGLVRGSRAPCTSCQCSGCGGDPCAFRPSLQKSWNLLRSVKLRRRNLYVYLSCESEKFARIVLVIDGFPYANTYVGAAPVGNAPLDTQNWRACCLHEEEEECDVLADFEKQSCTATKHITHTAPARPPAVCLDRNH